MSDLGKKANLKVTKGDGFDWVCGQLIAYSDDNTFALILDNKGNEIDGVEYALVDIQPQEVYHADTKKWDVSLVKCPNGLYPAKDANGNEITVTTHFITEPEAWHHLFTESEAWEQLCTIELNRAKAQLNEAKTDAKNAAKVFAEVRIKHHKSVCKLTQAK